METTDLDLLRYPIGKFQKPESFDNAAVSKWITTIEQLPGQLKATLSSFTDEQLDTPYRPGGWTVRQLVHHIADSHLNSYIRFKWTLTEDSPTIKAYNEKKWAELPEAKSAPIDISLHLLEALHVRWVLMLKNLSESDLNLYFVHPQTGNELTLATTLALYAWHSEHHLKHITNLKERMRW